MASYKELAGLVDHGELGAKVAVACLIAAEAIRAEDVGIPNHANRLLWAKETCGNWMAMGKKVLPMLVAQSKDLTSVNIVDATDAAIQTAVDSAVDIFATG